MTTHTYQIVHESINGRVQLIVGGPLPKHDADYLARQFNGTCPGDYNQMSYGIFKSVPYVRACV